MKYIFYVVLVLLLMPIIGSANLTATGGTITYDGNYTIHTFTSGGTFTPSFNSSVSVLVVAAGGGGGGLNYYSGGGGAGGLLYNSSYNVTSQGYTVTIGAGGAKASSSTTRGLNGGNSIFSTMTSTGGGGGAARTGETTGGNGGSGGGKGHDTAGGPGTGVSGQGYDGGAGYGGGGGGVSEVGGTVVTSPYGGDGGDGLSYNITGTDTYYAGGGGGGSYDVIRPGGLGGGGSGGDWSDTGSNTHATGGIDGLGGGGGGGSLDTNGGDGGGGVVIIRFNHTDVTPTFDLTINSSSMSSYYTYVDHIFLNLSTSMQDSFGVLLGPIEDLTGYIDSVNDTFNTSFDQSTGHKGIMLNILMPFLTYLPAEVHTLITFGLVASVIILVLRGNSRLKKS